MTSHASFAPVGMMMQGDLNQPPVVIRSSRQTALLLLIASIGFVVGGVMTLKDPGQNPIVTWLAIVFFGAGIPLFGWRLIRPDELTISPDGIVWHSIFRTTRFEWSDVQEFRAYAPTGKTRSKHVGFDFTDGYHERSKRVRKAVKTFAGVEGSLGSGWELGAADLADILNAARAKWAKDQVAVRLP